MNEIPSELFWGIFIAIFLIGGWIFHHFELMAQYRIAKSSRRTSPPNPDELFADLTEDNLYD